MADIAPNEADEGEYKNIIREINQAKAKIKEGQVNKFNAGDK
eukprot:gene39397-51931_t